MMSAELDRSLTTLRAPPQEPEWVMRGSYVRLMCKDVALGAAQE